MTGNKFFLDSNIVIEIFAGNKTIADKIYQLPEFYISSIVLGELYIGVNRVVNKEKHLAKLNSFLELATVLPVDDTTARLFGEITAFLYKKGKPIPTNDIWIAATIKQHDLVLVSRDKHFNEIADIQIDYW